MQFADNAGHPNLLTFVASMLSGLNATLCIKNSEMLTLKACSDCTNV